MSTRPPTLKDVAELAGVSKMAVSVVLSGRKSTVGVSEATRARILKACDELQYQPNAIARSLRLKRTDIVGVYSGSGLFNTREPFVREIFEGLAHGLTANKKDLLIFNSLNPSRRKSLVERVLSSKIDAAILLPSFDDMSLMQKLRKSSIPCITISEPFYDLRCVLADYADGSRALARYLLDKGHRRILYRRASFTSMSESARFDAFAAEVESAGAELISTRSVEPLDSVTNVEEELLLQNQRSKDRITAVACWRDHSAMRLLNFCLMQGMSVPHDIAIAGFDGAARSIMPSGMVLTTVDAHWQAIAWKATDIMAAILSGDDSAPQRTVVPADLFIGNTA